MEAEGKSPWFILERARRRQRVEAAQHGRAETEKRWIEDAAEKRRKDAIKREEVEKWANEDISRKWKETVRIRVKKKESMVQIQDNWNFMLSQQEYRLENQDGKFDTAEDNIKSKPLEENNIKDNPNKNIDLKSQMMEEESSKHYVGCSTFYKVGVIENKPKNNKIPNFNGSSSYKSHTDFEKSYEDNNNRKLPQYGFNTKDGICTSDRNDDISIGSQNQKDTNIELHIIQIPVTDIQDNNAKENGHININSLNSNFMEEPLETSEIADDKSETKPANIFHEECLIDRRKSTFVSDEVEIFV